MWPRFIFNLFCICIRAILIAFVDCKTLHVLDLYWWTPLSFYQLFLGILFLRLVVLAWLSVFAKWITRKTPLMKPKASRGGSFHKDQMEKCYIYSIVSILDVYYLFSPAPKWHVWNDHSVIAGFMPKVPAVKHQTSANQPTNQPTNSGPVAYGGFLCAFVWGMHSSEIPSFLVQSIQRKTRQSWRFHTIVLRSL